MRPSRSGVIVSGELPGAVPGEVSLSSSTAGGGSGGSGSSARRELVAAIPTGIAMTATSVTIRCENDMPSDCGAWGTVLMKRR